MKRFLIVLPLLFVLLAAAITGCNRHEERKAATVRVVEGDGQCTAPGQPFARPLVLEVADDQGVPVPGGMVRVEPLSGSELPLSSTEYTAGDDGCVRLNLAAGRKIGDQYLKVTPVGGESRNSCQIRLVTGMTVTGDRQEGPAGSVLPHPLTVRLYDAEGKPRSGVPVYFELTGTPTGSSARIFPTTVVTDADGEAETRIELGSGTGRNHLQVKAAGEGGSLLTRGVAVEVMGMNFLTFLINAFAGLAIFIFGMQQMSDGLQKVAGERMKGILRFFSRNRVVALLAGAGVTAVIQSSSASTVMVIGFINAGLLNLAQSIGIIIGTNIGTTITAQIVSFDVGILAMPAIIIGLLLWFIHWRNVSGIGQTVLGFGFLFFGMALMSEELSCIGTFPSVVRMFQHFDCTPVNGWMPFGAVMGALAIGLIVTMIIQSSSASTGIIIALGAGGLINLYTALPLVLGANIGTTVTAQLAAIAANRVAKQAALAHTLFNVIGVVLMLIGFYLPWGQSGEPVFFQLVDWVTGSGNVPRQIANAHTLFNVITALLLLPLTTQLAHLCEKIIPQRKKKVKITSLDPNLLESPAIALQQGITELEKMLRNAWNLLEKSVKAGVLEGSPDTGLHEEWRRKENRIDRMQEELTSYLVQLTRRPLTDGQAALVPVLTHCANDAERLADYAESVLNEAERLAECKERFSRKSDKALRELLGGLGEMVQRISTSLEHNTVEDSENARQTGRDILRRAGKLEDEHLESLRKGEYNVEAGVIFIGLVGIVRQAVTRLDNIAARCPQLISEK